MTATEYKSLIVEKNDQVATVRMKLYEMGNEMHWDLGVAFNALREDNSIRVIVLTGAEEGTFHTTFTKDWTDQTVRDFNEPGYTWTEFAGILRTIPTMIEIEKPIIARVNGDCSGAGQSLMFACDLIVAREDARIADTHMAQGEFEPYGPPFDVVPGDGGAALVPMHMSPARAKEYLMLGKEYSAAQLAQIGAINYAVPLSKLDDVVNDLIRRLLKRSAYSLAWTKRVANRQMAQHVNLTLDAAAGYEMVNLLQLERQDFTRMNRLG
jgi:enoyl-CoA hydratase